LSLIVSGSGAFLASGPVFVVIWAIVFAIAILVLVLRFVAVFVGLIVALICSSLRLSFGKSFLQRWFRVLGGFFHFKYYPFYYFFKTNQLGTTHHVDSCSSLGDG
jgi:hypothetical protein